MNKPASVLLVSLLACGAPAEPAKSAPAPSTAPAAAPATAAREQPRPVTPPPGFVEGSFGDLHRDGFEPGRHMVFIRGKDTGAVPGGLDDLSFEFIERFRKDRAAAIKWAESKPELEAELALATRLERAQYELEGNTFVFHLFDQNGPVESERPHVAILVSGAPFFVQIEALEGFGYSAPPK